MTLVWKGVDIICMCIYNLLTSMIVISMIFKWYDLYFFLVYFNFKVVNFFYVDLNLGPFLFMSCPCLEP